MQSLMGETPKTALHRCINLCKVAKSPSAPCSLLPISTVNFTFVRLLIINRGNYPDN
ncbi:MAG: hypothetical protein F6K59_24505 [Moorea sp. SIO3F7]|nr:hypothetical protein [Moorena sp. SIO3F7]